jgi:hypothetical protein
MVDIVADRNSQTGLWRQSSEPPQPRSLGFHAPRTDNLIRPNVTKKSTDARSHAEMTTP